jgi:23S rRNA-/tRNA-specific pseudouridylate synthase
MFQFLIFVFDWIQIVIVENVIYMYQSALFERYPNESFQFKVSAPQRLDNDTSGVLILSIKSSFASYMGKLLEAKTLCHVGQGAQVDHPPTAISKFYKMLVCIKTVDLIKNLQKLASTKEKVTHYLSPERSERRIFSMASDDVRNDSKWLECNLKVISVGFNASVLYLPVNRLNDMPTPAPGEGSFISMSTKYAAVTEVEVELLTGRTHQIRGQMAALGFPLVGDSTYGGDVMIRHEHKIALHCSQITFPKPVLVDEPPSDRNKTPSDRNKRACSQLHPSTSDSLTFHSSCTWWDDHINM